MSGLVRHRGVDAGERAELPRSRRISRPDKLIWGRVRSREPDDARGYEGDERRNIMPGEMLSFSWFRATATEVVFAGWLKIYGVEEEAEKKAESEKPSEEEENKQLPPLSENERLQLIKLHHEQHFTEPPPRLAKRRW